MARERAKTEVRERPVAPLLPKDFVDRAPTACGPDALMDWLDNHNLYNAVKQEVAARLNHLPLDTLGPLVKYHIEHSLEDRARTVSQVLWRYADIRHQIITYHDPDSVYWREVAQVGMTGALRKKLTKPGRDKRLKERQLVLEQLITDLGLDAERAVIDCLLEEASAVPARQAAEKGPVVRFL